MASVMTHKRLVSAFRKAGCTVTEQERRGNPSFIAENPKTGECVEWHTQPKFVHVKGGDSYYDEKDPITTYVVARSPQTDIMTDCFCDSFYHSIKSAVAAIA
jgi:hypothetical protein